MTITNHASDGLYPELIVLFRTVVESGRINKDDLIRVCTAKEEKDGRVRATLATWTDLGLFLHQEGEVAVAQKFAGKRNESVDAAVDRLPGICRELMFDPRHALPLWPPDGRRSDEGIGPTADFVRESAWMMAQDIYRFPIDSPEREASALENAQVVPPKFIFVNEARWPGVRFWARFTGLTSTSRGYIDPTDAIRQELPQIFQGAAVLRAVDFVRELSERIPVLDGGRYRLEVEGALHESRWRRPPDGQLSMSLSLALRRLQLDHTLALEALADDDATLMLSGRDFRPWIRFSHVKLLGGKQ
jgi:hypothetical protein